MDACIDELKLVALDRDDLDVLSAHLQDATVRVGDVFWQPDNHRFVMALNRFDWMSAVDGNAESASYRRCRTALRFERVNACKYRNLDQAEKNTLLNLLAVEFSENNAPAGVVSLIFSGGGIIRLDVECLEAELADLGEVSPVAICPDHFAAGRSTA